MPGRMIAKEVGGKVVFDFMVYPHHFELLSKKVFHNVSWRDKITFTDGVETKPDVNNVETHGHRASVTVKKVEKHPIISAQFDLNMRSRDWEQHQAECKQFLEMLADSLGGLLRLNTRIRENIDNSQML